VDCGRSSTTEQLAVLRILVDRRRSLGDDHTRMISQLHQLLLQLIPGGAKKDLSAAQAKVLLASVAVRFAAPGSSLIAAPIT
jgi:transposase